jgi:hypothetical protein
MARPEIPPIGGTGNARAIAEIHAILANSGVAKGKRFLSEAGCRKAREIQVSGRDRILGFPICNGLGFAVAGGVFTFPNKNTIYWEGMEDRLRSSIWMPAPRLGTRRTKWRMPAVTCAPSDLPWNSGRRWG